MTWHLRHDYDRAVYESVFVANEYGVPEDMTGLVVLDIGACFGAFARLCAGRGAAVHAYEPCPESFALLQRHAEGLAVRAYREAVLDAAGTGTLAARADPAGRTLYGGGGIEVPVVAFDEAVRRAGGRVDLCKIDVEGCEYNIIPACDFAGVREMCVEFHAHYVGEWERRSEECRRRLADLGFRETCWEATHVEHGWYRLWKGKRP